MKTYYNLGLPDASAFCCFSISNFRRSSSTDLAAASAISCSNLMRSSSAALAAASASSFSSAALAAAKDHTTSQYES